MQLICGLHVETVALTVAVNAYSYKKIVQITNRTVYFQIEVPHTNNGKYTILNKAIVCTTYR